MSEGLPVPDEFPPSSRDRERQLPATEAARRLSRALELEPRTGDMAAAPVREAICDFVAELKGAGVPPERMLVQVKEVIAEARRAHSDRDREADQEFLQRVIKWCIDEYYRASE